MTDTTSASTADSPGPVGTTTTGGGGGGGVLGSGGGVMMGSGVGVPTAVMRHTAWRPWESVTCTENVPGVACRTVKTVPCPVAGLPYCANHEYGERPPAA